MNPPLVRPPNPNAVNWSRTPVSTGGAPRVPAQNTMGKILQKAIFPSTVPAVSQRMLDGLRVDGPADTALPHVQEALQYYKLLNQSTAAQQ